MGGFALILGPALKVLSGLTTVAMSVQNNKAAAEEARNNAKLAQINADITRSEGRVAQARAAEEAHRALGRQRAGQAESGILGSATGALLLDQTQAKAAQEQLNIINQTGQKAQGYLEEAQSRRNAANRYTRAAGQDILGGAIDTGRSVLGTVSQAYSG